MYEKPDTEYANGTIAEVLQPGYVMHDRLLRPRWSQLRRAMLRTRRLTTWTRSTQQLENWRIKSVWSGRAAAKFRFALSVSNTA